MQFKVTLTEEWPTCSDATGGSLERRKLGPAPNVLNWNLQSNKFSGDPFVC